MTEEERYKIVSNEYTDLIIDYNQNLNFLNRFPNSTTQIINPRFAIAYVPNEQLNDNYIKQNGYASLPHCYGLTSQNSLESSGVQTLRRIPDFNLRGQGVLIGMIDTGIDYTNPIFIKSDGTSKIVKLWDQTIQSEIEYPQKILYGTEYNNEKINLALKSKNPFEVVPSIDEIGHGTMLAGIVAGNEVLSNNFSGVVPDADLLVVKLKQAKPALRTFFEIPNDVPCYQENDIIWAVEFLTSTALSANRPISICIGLGTSQGSHDGRGPLDNLLYYIALFPNTCISVAAGNEGNLKRHFFSKIDPKQGYSTLELKVGDNESGFLMELWGTTPDTYSIDITSPTGEYTPRIEESLKVNRTINYIFERTVIHIDYQIVETHAGDQLILLRFHNPTSGIWKFNVYSKGNLPGAFHVWLPMGNFISQNTYFIQADPNTTITAPGDSISLITVTAYNPINTQLYPEASRGYTRINVVKPELAAPGYNVVAPTLEHGFANFSGTGIAAAHTSGITAMLLEWGVMKENYPVINTQIIKEYLIRGAKRDNNLEYPNKEWGYGIIDVYGVFNTLLQSK